jgi:hypothetical protein
MSDDLGFTPPPFKPAEALVGLKRSLRELGLTERGAAFELRGRAVVELSAGDHAIEARRVKRPQATPEWASRQALRSGADIRRFVDDTRQQLRRWSAAAEE